ncbi:MAG: DnaJ C-terminal domain-containing protein [Limnothrix sp.]|uniref:DnaJ C-terminal domain-containing protein n=1 Tax=unclassified Limnothrix TaxID=2632864 RepID=UPI00081DB475|nr:MULTISPECIES: DnaJ C-terminal domain-containing protein [unclassified Limnothrix]MEB3117937.1 DnaJ C-terminal domain-containing protein [Limnothrix sp.]OCQ93223.1 molecular chaperone DnaJ [Limnothrix sp. P13C2]MBD2159727.1 DnaJ domain-containing protein [Limnothrix sp. FACHB-1083]MBD2190430.1 DnaJ domain-containing protein [Limnothrix sp. FACHB-1088]MBD2551879.1 DnaJ domain-containing protein [Limnothrix sp. FACHB-708]
MAATDFKDYYAVLGLTKTASAEEIKKTYRRLARKYHPDLNPGDKQAEARFKEVNEAYEVLSDADKRQKYDRFGQYWQQADRAGQAWGGTGAGGAGFDDFEFGRYGSFDEFINELLGRFGGPGAAGTRSSSYNYRSGTGSNYSGNYNSSNFGGGFSGFGDVGGFGPQSAAGDREATLALSFGEAFNGTQKRLSLGAETITVRIPPGAKPGSKIRLKGKGQYDPYSRQRGDLYLKVSLNSHNFFQFEGDTLVCEIPIAPDEAVLGTKADVPTPDGLVTMNVPAGIKSGQTLRLRGKGWVEPSGKRGDLLVRVAVTLPSSPTAAERAAYEQVRAARSTDPRSHLRSVQL